MKEWYLYVLLCADGSYYCGVTTDLERRLYEHNQTAKGAKYTRSRRPSSYIHTKVYRTRRDALQAEYSFKRLTRKQKEEFINAAAEHET